MLTKHRATMTAHAMREMQFASALGSGETRPYEFDMKPSPLAPHASAWLDLVGKTTIGSSKLVTLPFDYEAYSMEVERFTPPRDHATGLNASNVACLKKAYDHLDLHRDDIVYHVHIDSAETDHQLRAVVFQATRRIRITVCCNKHKAARAYRDHAEKGYEKVESIEVVDRTPDSADIILSYLTLQQRHNPERYVRDLHSRLTEHGSLIAVYPDIASYKGIKSQPGVRLISWDDDIAEIELDGVTHKDYRVDLSSMEGFGPFDDVPHKDFFGGFPESKISNNNYVPRDMMAAVHRPRNSIFRVLHLKKETHPDNTGNPIYGWPPKLKFPRQVFTAIVRNHRFIRAMWTVGFRSRLGATCSTTPSRMSALARRWMVFW